MKICFVSDLHVDMNSTFIQWSNYPADAIIVAGDVANSIGNTVKTLNKLAKKYPKVIYVIGNHENYANNSAKRTVQELEQKISAGVSDNVIVLTIDNHYQLEEFTFIGSCGWYSFDFGANDIEYCKQQYLDKDSNMNDNHNIGFSSIKQPMPWELAKSEAEHAYLKVQETIKANPLAKIVMVTHTAPCGLTVETTPEFLDSNPYYVNSHMEKILKDFKDNIIVWAHGHTHFRSMKMYDGIVPIVVNPRGYGHQNENWEPVVLDFI